MIPSVIHYCWFGHNPLPKQAIKCIESWKRYLPECEIKEWNEENFDVNIIPYTREAYEAKKYAFVSDYARFWILYNYGGIYFDTDVEVIKPMDNILAKGAFMGMESDSGKVAPGLGLACTPKQILYKEFLDLYSSIHFIEECDNRNQITIVDYTTDVLKKYGLEQDVNTPQKIANIFIYPKDYFCPMSPITNKITITPNTYSIHHYSASWMDKKRGKVFKDLIKSILSEKLIFKCIQIKKKIIFWNKE